MPASLRASPDHPHRTSVRPIQYNCTHRHAVKRRGETGRPADRLDTTYGRPRSRRIRESTPRGTGRVRHRDGLSARNRVPSRTDVAGAREPAWLEGRRRIGGSSATVTRKSAAGGDRLRVSREPGPVVASTGTARASALGSSPERDRRDSERLLRTHRTPRASERTRSPVGRIALCVTSSSIDPNAVFCCRHPRCTTRTTEPGGCTVASAFVTCSADFVLPATTGRSQSSAVDSRCERASRRRRRRLRTQRARIGRLPRTRGLVGRGSGEGHGSRRRRLDRPSDFPDTRWTGGRRHTS